MRYRIYTDNGRMYDVDSIPNFRGNSLTKVTTLKWNNTVYLNKTHIVSIEEVVVKESSPQDIDWIKKNEEYAKTSSKKKFKNLIKR